MKIFGITGQKNSGKTNLTGRLIHEFRQRGLMVSAIKHAHHAADIDVEGTDSFHLRAQGAGQVILSTPARWALMTELHVAAEPMLSDLIAHLEPCDIVLVEGYKTAPHPKIECHRPETGRPLLGEGYHIIAVASTAAPETALPVLGHDDTAALADFVWDHAQVIR
ncbi:molybdopterin-guanine dinucleotide biosynthesis protein B [Paracoccus zhejiangensis]|uniref:Molybdopterin-guanine dinucleotide biosynthesis protein B n=1 Tax=Paracoccus zhejiangensis TaxID=1077935 RepID=A0A2H5F2U9_9RHOB|nr:molybdopterin-guanine dinucleotide biosynthesis protein B [Paracoccus zhejiangensis]AUH65878.1 molybdopterin-guanine dinucleotide biosynthesis protein B [Paracoccus zhejiangensis]